MECLLRYASLFISLDACCWRYCLFPEPWLKTLKFLNSPSAQTARIFYAALLFAFFKKNLRLDPLTLRCAWHQHRVPPLFCRPLFYTTSLPASWCSCYVTHPCSFRLMPVVCATAYFRNPCSSR